MKLFNFFKKPIFGHIVKALGLYVVLFILLLITLRLYTHHGKSQPVPDFKGLDAERVEQLADYNNLRVNIVDSSFIDYLPKGSVIDQNPLPGVKVKRNRTVFLTINAFTQAKVEMPNLIGLSFRQGKTTLENRGLRVGRLIYVPDYAKNNVLKQQFNGDDIEPGVSIEKGQAIDLILGNGFGKSHYPLPDLFKMTYLQATDQINDSYFNVGKVAYDESVQNYNDTINALVWKQRPAYVEGQKSPMGIKVDIWLSVDKERFPESDTTQIDINE